MKCADVLRNLYEETAIHGHKWGFIVSICLYQASPQIVSWLLLPVFELLLLSAQTPAKWKAFHDPGPLDGMPGAWYCCWPKLCTSLHHLVGSESRCFGVILSKSSFNPPHQTSPEGSLPRSCGSQGPTSIKYWGDLCLSLLGMCVFFNVSKLLHLLPF